MKCKNFRLTLCLLLGTWTLLNGCGPNYGPDNSGQSGASNQNVANPTDAGAPGPLNSIIICATVLNCDTTLNSQQGSMRFLATANLPPGQTAFQANTGLCEWPGPQSQFAYDIATPLSPIPGQESCNVISLQNSVSPNSCIYHADNIVVWSTATYSYPASAFTLEQLSYEPFDGAGKPIAGGGGVPIYVNPTVDSVDFAKAIGHVTFDCSKPSPMLSAKAQLAAILAKEKIRSSFGFGRQSANNPLQIFNGDSKGGHYDLPVVEQMGPSAPKKATI